MKRRYSARPSTSRSAREPGDSLEDETAALWANLPNRMEFPIGIQDVASFRARPPSELHSLNATPLSGRVMQSRL
jgi:hypothetical protein